MKVKFFNIKWDTESDFDDEPVDLPTELTLDVPDDEIDLDFEGADMLSDKTGFCVFSFEYEILE
jgi:hypothetical protein